MATGVSALSGTQASAASTAASAASGLGAGLGGVDFLKLLTTQLKYQDPMNPMQGSDMAAQLAQFSSVQGINQLNTSFTNMLLLQGLTQGANLIGKTVGYDNGSGTPARGTVKSVQVQNGNIQLVVDGGVTVALNQIRTLEAPRLDRKEKTTAAVGQPFQADVELTSG